MWIQGKYYRSIWIEEPDTIAVIDQRYLPFEVKIAYWKHWQDVQEGIRQMQVRGAPLIGVSAAFGLYLATKDPEFHRAPYSYLQYVGEHLKKARPTAINLAWAVERVLARIRPDLPPEEVRARVLDEATRILEEDVRMNRALGQQGARLLRQIWEEKGKPPVLTVLTHCNAGWIATVDFGTVTSVLYHAIQEEQIPLEVVVSETRPRNQGARLTAWELRENGISCILIADNASGYLLQQNQIDLVLVGADRVTRRGDTANKIGTWMKAVCARESGTPFYVALPYLTIDATRESGDEIPIEHRSEDEVLYVEGTAEHGALLRVRITVDGVRALNPAFDITPAEYITGFILPDGVVSARDFPRWLDEKLPAPWKQWIGQEPRKV